MKKLFPLAVLATSAVLAQAAPRYPYSASETQAFLGHLAAHVMVINSDLTLRKQAPANAFELLTHYPLPADKVDEYKRNCQIANRKDDIADFVTYRIKDYALANEKNETLRIQDDGDPSLQDFALWTYDNVLSGQLGLSVQLDKRFERVKGHMTIVFEMPGKLAREVRVPVDLSIRDKDPRPGI